MPEATRDLYKVYEGNGAVTGTFISTGTVTGVIWNDILFNDLTTKIFNSANAGKSDAELVSSWAAELEKASDQLRATIK